MDNRDAFLLGVAMVIAIPVITDVSDTISMIQSHDQPKPEPHSPSTEELQSQASGPSLFWALLALALYSMTQPSVVGHWLSGSTFEGLMWPHRSLPLVCVADTVVGINELVKARLTVQGRQRQQHSQQRLSHDSEHENGQSEDVNYAAFLLNIAIFLVGILPQAIQIFSMRGIMHVQSAAAIFFVSSLWGLFRSSPLFSRHDPTEHEKLILSIGMSEQERQSARVAASLDIIWKIFVFHSLLLVGPWTAIGKAITIQTSLPDLEVTLWIQLVCLCIPGLIISEAVIRRPAQTTPSVRRTKTFLLACAPWLLASTMSLCIPEPEKFPFAGLSLQLLFAAACFSFAVALRRAAAWMYSCVNGGREIISHATSYSRISGQTQAEGHLQSGESSAPRQPQGMEGDIGLQSLDSGRPDAGASGAAQTNIQPAAQSDADVEALSPGITSDRLTDAIASVTVTDADAPGHVPEENVAPFPNSESRQAQGPPASRVKRSLSLLTRILKDVGSVPLRLGVGYFEVCMLEPALLILTVFLKHPIEAWVALAMLNLGTAAIYFFFVFDGSGTWAPKWSQALG